MTISHTARSVDAEVVIVGGGPAGAATAWALARAGVDVVILDRARFPRDKPCGGGLTLRAVRQCPVDPTPVVEELVDRLELRFRYGNSVVRQAREPVVWMTQRRRLDAFLLDAARDRGVEVREGTTVEVGKIAADVIVGANIRWGMMFKMIPPRQEFIDYVARIAARPAAHRAETKDKNLAAKAA